MVVVGSRFFGYILWIVLLSAMVEKIVATTSIYGNRTKYYENEPYKVSNYESRILSFVIIDFSKRNKIGQI